MSHDRRALVLATSSSSTSQEVEDRHQHEDADDNDESPYTRDVHALTPPRVARGPPWETSSNRSSSLSMASSSSENFTTMSREFSALVLAGSTLGSMEQRQQEIHNHNHNNLSRIREEDNISQEETNPLAIVPDNNPGFDYPSRFDGGGDRRRDGLVLSTADIGSNNIGEQVSVQSVKKEEVESKISAWQNAKISKINNRFKREDAVINGWESEQVQTANSWMKKVERKLEEKRAKALEKMQNDIVKARRKAEERRASAEAKRGTKVAKILEISNLMRAVGRAPVKRSFF